MQLRSTYRCLPLFSMLYVMSVIVPATIGYRLIGLGPFLINAGTCIFPFSYLFGDFVTELYGYDVARKIIWSSVLCSLIFGFVVSVVFYLPIASSVAHQSSYHYVLSRSFVFLFGGSLGGVLGAFFNSYLLAKWKLLLKGRYFWLRSIGSSLLGDFLELLVITLVAYVEIYPMHVIFRMFSTVYIFRVVFCCIAAYPAQCFMDFMKKGESADVYDKNTHFNPFRLS